VNDHCEQLTTERRGEVEHQTVVDATDVHRDTLVFLPQNLDVRLRHLSPVVVEKTCQTPVELPELVTEDQRQHERRSLRKYVRRHDVENDGGHDHARNERVACEDVVLKRGQIEVVAYVSGDQQEVDEQRRAGRDDRPRHCGAERGESSRVSRAGIVQDLLVEHDRQPAAEAGRAERRLRDGALDEPADRLKLVEQRRTELVVARERGNHSDGVDPQQDDNEDRVNHARIPFARLSFPIRPGGR